MRVTSLPTRLGEALAAVPFTYDAVADRLGPRAHEALGRNETTPGVRRTGSSDALDTLIRLFLLQVEVPLECADRALPGLVEELCTHGVLEQSVSQVRARLDVRPYAADDLDLWVTSDLTPGLDGAPVRVGADHVLGISPASASLAQLTIREPVGRALDLGTGCGVQALHLAEHAEAVVATDVNRRALWLAEFNRELNGVPRERIDVREGSFFAPVAGERFDLIATNPPFVISPATGERLVYRDSGLPGDRVVEDLVRTAPDHLSDGGWCQVLANWIVHRDLGWDERLAGWLEEGGCDALVIQREVIDPASYVELWLKDSGHHGGPGYATRYDTWLSWLDEQGVTGIGFGWINLHRTGSAAPAVRLEEWPYDVEQPIAPAIAAWGSAASWLRDTPDAELLATRLVLEPDVVQETLGAPGAEDPETVILRGQRGFRRARQVDTVSAALAGACDGELALGQILDALAELLDLDAAAARASYLTEVRELISEGFLTGR